MRISASPHQTTSAYAGLHKSNRLYGLLPLSLEWLDALPPQVRPIRLIKQYPRLVNLVALEWNHWPVAGTLLTDLLNADCGGQDGFPAAVSRELRALLDHYCKGLTATPFVAPGDKFGNHEVTHRGNDLVIIRPRLVAGF